MSNFCLLNCYSKIITAGDDSVTKVFTHNPGQDLVDTMELIDHDDEMYALCSNGADAVVFGGKDKQANIWKIQSGSADDELKFEKTEKTLAMMFDSPVMCLEYYFSLGKVLGVSQDSFVSVYDVEKGKVTNFE